MKTPHFRHAYRTLLFIIAYTLPIIQFVYARSLWCDEAAMALNIMNRNFGQLLYPLDYIQGAPILYLWTVKGLTLVFGTGERALRLLSLLAYLASVPLMLKLLRRILTSELAVLAGLTFYVLNSRLLYYAGELKPYMTDIVWTQVLLLIALAPDWSMQRRSFILAITGSVAIFASNAMFAVLPMIFLIITFTGRDHWAIPFFKRLVMMGTCWMLAFGLFMMVFVKDHPSTAILRAEFRKTKQIPPSDLLSDESLQFWAKTCRNLQRDFLLGVNNVYPTDQIPTKLFHADVQFHVTHPWTFQIIHSLDLFILALLGCMFLLSVIRGRWIRLLCLLPLGIHALMAYLGLLPIANRLLLYTYPLVVVILASGLDQVLVSFPGRRQIVAIGLTGYAAFTTIAMTRAYIPHEVMEIRAVAAQVQSKIRNDQILFVIPQARTMFLYYYERGVIHPNKPVVMGRRLAGLSSVDSYCKEIRGIQEEKWVLIGNLWDTQAIEMAQKIRRQGDVIIDSAVSKGIRAYLVAGRQ